MEPLISRGKTLHGVFEPTAIDVSKGRIGWHIFFSLAEST